MPVLYENGLTYCHISHHTEVNHSSFTSIKHLHEIPTESPPVGALNTCGVYKFRDFRPISRYISQTIQDSAIVTMEGEYELVCNLSNGDISNDFERTLLNSVFKVRYGNSLTLNISQTATDTAIVTIEGE